MLLEFDIWNTPILTFDFHPSRARKLHKTKSDRRLIIKKFWNSKILVALPASPALRPHFLGPWAKNQNSAPNILFALSSDSKKVWHNFPAPKTREEIDLAETPLFRGWSFTSELREENFTKWNCRNFSVSEFPIYHIHKIIKEIFFPLGVQGDSKCVSVCDRYNVT